MTAESNFVKGLIQALSYIARPSMGLPGGADPEQFARLGATEANVRTALATCIVLAQQALGDPLEHPDDCFCPGCHAVGANGYAAIERRIAGEQLNRS